MDSKEYCMDMNYKQAISPFRFFEIILRVQYLKEFTEAYLYMHTVYHYIYNFEKVYNKCCANNVHFSSGHKQHLI